MKRRSFLRTTAATTFTLGSVDRLFALEAGGPFRQNIGLQLYTLRDALAKDPAATLKAVAAAGYKQVEPFGFPDSQPQIDGAKDAGLAIHSTHFAWDSVVNPKDEKMSDFRRILDQAHKLGLSDMVIPYLQDNDRKSLDDYKRIAGNSNKAAALTKEAGIQLAYHNHNFEFDPMEGGKCGMDILVAEFSPEMMFEVDVFWVKLAGVDPVAWIEKLKGRVSQLHLKDLKKGSEIPSFASPPADAFKELGNGMIPMEPILAAAAKSGVRFCHVEQDQSPDAMASIRESIAHLGKL